MCLTVIVVKAQKSPELMSLIPKNFTSSILSIIVIFFANKDKQIYNYLTYTNKTIYTLFALTKQQVSSLSEPWDSSHKTTMKEPSSAKWKQGSP